MRAHLSLLEELTISSQFRILLLKLLVGEGKGSQLAPAVVQL